MKYKGVTESFGIVLYLIKSVHYPLGKQFRKKKKTRCGWSELYCFYFFSWRHCQILTLEFGGSVTSVGFEWRNFA